MYELMLIYYQLFLLWYLQIYWGVGVSEGIQIHFSEYISNEDPDELAYIVNQLKDSAGEKLFPISSASDHAFQVKFSSFKIQLKCHLFPNCQPDIVKKILFVTPI